MKKKINKSIVIILILVIIFIGNLLYNYFLNNKETFINKSFFEVKDSNLLGKGERGLFATKNYKQNDIIEICPTLKMKPHEVSDSNILNNHFFEGNDKETNLVSLGHCSIINHSDKKQNCTWKVSKDDNTITFYAIKPIKKGEELYTHYGNQYWANKTTKI